MIGYCLNNEDHYGALNDEGLCKECALREGLEPPDELEERHGMGTTSAEAADADARDLGYEDYRDYEENELGIR